MGTSAPSRGRHAAFTPSLPSLLAEDVRTGLVEYLSTTYSLADPAARNVLAAFLDSSEHGIFRGPYLRLRPPFRSVTPTWASPLSWMPAGFTPYLHQARAFERLSSRDHAPRPTLVTTGTGSGKTEAFLLPLLDHARRAHGRGPSGITAIILYPMNALATDQARRIAQTVSSAPELDGVRVGLYIGGDGHHRVMSAEHVIDHRDTLRTHPPHILLTNYKMLDLLLMDPRHADLWRGAGQDLHYLVLDEFHTYDGAQGTDVAMLLRRRLVAAGGLVATQFPPGTHGSRITFPMRNAVMSGYGLATVVVAAGEHSGTRIQARKALDHGRGLILTERVTRETTWGAHYAHRPGVTVARRSQDVLDAVSRLIEDRRTLALR